MICPKCRAATHEGQPEGCPGKGQCNCQHRLPYRVPAQGCGAYDPEHSDGLCGLPARLYAAGWRCEAHKP